MTDNSNYDPNAASSMLGYIYQIRYALYMCLRQLNDVDDPDEHNISLEKFDDIALDHNGKLTIADQIKGHDLTESNKNQGNLTDRSSDIWSTIRVWVKLIKDKDAELGKTVFRIITTQSFSNVSVASYLSDTSNRSPEKAIELLNKISTETTNKQNLEGYIAFQSLSPAEKVLFVESIYMIGQSENLDEIDSKINKYTRNFVTRRRANAFTERLSGKWLEICTNALKETPTSVLNLGEIQSFIDSVRREYTDENLPDEFTNSFPEVVDAVNDPRPFVQQLKLINLPANSLEKAIVDYFRSYEQRNKWSEDGLLFPGELQKYNDQLTRQWDDFKEEMEELEDLETDRDVYKAAKRLYFKCRSSHGALPIRRDFMKDYVAKGSYHMLSDDLIIGWHPNYKDLLAHPEEGEDPA